jgi:hypothetical protein
MTGPVLAGRTPTEVTMIRSLRIALAGGLLVALAGASSTTAADGNHKVLDATLAGIPASLTGQVFMGAQGGGLPWRLDSGRAKLWSDGRLAVEVDGLVLAAGSNEGRNPVPTGRALVACEGVVVAMSDPVPYSAEGDASVEARVDLPAHCLAPVVFFAGNTGAGPRWFAVTGY